MSRKSRNRRMAMLSPLAFALTFGAYAGSGSIARDPRVSSPQEETPRISREAREEVNWLTDWIERHGQA